MTVVAATSSSILETSSLKKQKSAFLVSDLGAIERDGLYSMVSVSVEDIQNNLLKIPTSEE